MSNRPIQVSYTIREDGNEGYDDAATSADVAAHKMREDWKPVHWHLDAVSWNEERVICTFTVIPGFGEWGEDNLDAQVE